MGDSEHAQPYDPDELCFAAEDPVALSADSAEKWLVLIVDDEEEIHSVTKLALADVVFQGRAIHLLDAYSEKDTLRLMREHPDIAVVLLDIVMEEDDSGLKLVRQIREELRNHFVRIVIRTAQPGQAPERNVIVDYDINDYREKAELTAQKLFSTVIALLRSYDNLMAIERNRRGLHSLVQLSHAAFGYRRLEDFADKALDSVFSILAISSPHGGGRPDSLLALSLDEGFLIASAHGRFTSAIGQLLEPSLEREDVAALAPLLGIAKGLAIKPSALAAKFTSKTGIACIIYITGVPELCAYETSLLQLLFTTLGAGFNSLCLDTDMAITHNEILITLGQVVEARSHETGNHVRRVAEYSRLLASKYGLGDDEASLLRQAAALHDIGKVAVPDHILNKPASLDAEELATMQTHTLVGHDIFKNSTRRLFQAAAIVALQHHERYDGQGYPHGLCGENIHLYGRIVSLADVFDAISSDRHYKRAWDMKDVLDYLREQNGKAFDPRLIDLFFENIDEILTIRQRFADTRADELPSRSL